MKKSMQQATGVSRRTFLGTLGAGLGVAGLGLMGVQTASAEEPVPVKYSGKKAILFDGSKCVGCHYCEGGCKNVNELAASVDYDVNALADTVIPKTLLPYEMVQASKKMVPVTKDDRDASRWLRVVRVDVEKSEDEIEPVFVRHACTHCGLCAQVCPSKALVQREDGIVTMDESLCIGCYYCYQACPFDIPRYREEGEDRAMQKCSMCALRMDEGEQPACVESCPSGALSFGAVEDMVTTGKDSLSALVSEGYSEAYLYGEKELGGIGVVNVLPYAPKTCGMPKLRQE